jgi:hypothetical protein
MMALDALCGAVPSEMVPTIAKKEMAKETWDTIATMRVGDECVKKATTQQLRRKFNLTTFDNGETVEDYALCLSSIATHLATLSEEVKDSEIIVKMLRSLPPHFKQITITMKTLLDVSTMSVADLIGLLKEVEEEFEEAPTSLQQDGKLYLTEEEWDARRKKREAENHSSSSARGGGTSKGRGCDWGRGCGGSSAGGSSSGRPTGDECRRCGKLGHWARECRSKPKEQVHITQDEEEASFMLTTATLFRPKAGRTKTGGPTAPVREVRSLGESSAGTSTQGSMVEVILSSAEVEIHEEKVFAHHDEEKECDAETWVLNTRAMNHMYGCRVAFTKIDTAVLSTVCFGDDSVARIEGRGTVVFLCKNGESRSFDGVYKIDINISVMKIREPGGVLLVKVKQEENRLDLLYLKFTQPTCLAVRGRGDEVAWCCNECFGHVNMVALRKLAREELVHGLPEIGQVG